MDFNQGDVVALKSGGPAMTVESVGQRNMTGEDAVFCVWYERIGNKQMVRRDAFHPSTLKEFEPIRRGPPIRFQAF